MAETKKYSTQEEAPKQMGYTKTYKPLKPTKGASVNDFDDTVVKYKSPAKNMKTGEYKHSFEGGYKPYKMLGHELPGPNQRTPATLRSFDASDGAINENMVRKTSTTPGKYSGGVGSSPAKELLMTEAGQAAVQDAQGGVGQAAKRMKKMRVAPHGDESHTGGGGAAVAGGEEEEAPWEVMKYGAFSDMGKGERRKYMKGLDKKQRQQQMISNVKTGGLGGMMGGFNRGGSVFGGGFGGIFSDIRLKEKIERTGESPSGIPTYEFNYIGDNNRYSGAMAQDLLEMNIDAVSMGDDGFYRVNYDNIDVDMRLIN